MREGQRGGVVDVVATGRSMAAVGGQGPGRVIDDDVGPVPEHLGFHTDRGDQAHLGRGDANTLDRGDRFGEGSRQIVVRGRELVRELVVAPLESGIALGDQHPLVRVADALDVDAKPETVEELRAQLALLGVHRPYEDEARRMGERDTLSLDYVHAHGGGVEQDVHQVVVQEVHLIDVQNVAVRLGEDARLEAPGAGAQRGFDVDGPNHPVL